MKQKQVTSSQSTKRWRHTRWFRIDKVVEWRQGLNLLGFCGYRFDVWQRVAITAACHVMGLWILYFYTCLCPTINNEASGVSIYLWCNFKHREGPDETAVSDGARALHHRTTFLPYLLVQSGSLIEVHSGKIEFSEVASIVHVVQKCVDICGNADAWNQTKSNLHTHTHTP